MWANTQLFTSSVLVLPSLFAHCLHSTIIKRDLLYICAEMVHVLRTAFACATSSSNTTALAAAGACLRALSTGATYTLTKVFTQQDASEFAALTGDSNPIHTDKAAANVAGHAAPILPGMLMASMFPAIIGSNFPGALYLKQQLKFRKPALVGSSITAEVRVSSKSGNRVTFETACRDASGILILDGTALAKIKEQKAAAEQQQ
jgi:3-hydroxybutyryl-CoA dehydratase